jgi:hypothetical protein
MPDPIDLTAKVRSCFENRDYEGLVKVMSRPSMTNPDEPEPERSKRCREGNQEDQRLADEFEIHVENLKNEAIRQFDGELYTECQATFRFLCQLEPENGMIRDYLALCSKLTATAAEAPSPDSGISPLQGQEVYVQDSPQPAIESPPPGNPPAEVREVVNSSEVFRGTAEIEYVDSKEHSDESQILEIPGYSDDHPSSEPVGGQPLEPMSLERKPGRLAWFRREWLTFALAVSIILTMTRVIGLRSVVHRRYASPKVLVTQLNHERDSQPSAYREKTVSERDIGVQLLQKAEASMLAGRYSRPANDNAVAYCDQVLAEDPHNQRALDLRKTSIHKAALQAKIRARAGKIEEARETFMSLLEMSQHESSFPYSALELEKELRKLEFEAYPVVHDHFLFGSCTGQLRFNSYVISYESAARSRHGFTAGLMEIRLGKPGGKLKIQVGDRTYRFEPGPGGITNDRHQTVQAIYQQLAHLGVRSPS